MTTSTSVVLENEEIAKLPLAVHLVKKQYRSAVASLEFAPLLGGSRVSIDNSSRTYPGDLTQQYLRNGFGKTKKVMGKYFKHLTTPLLSM